MKILSRDEQVQRLGINADVLDPTPQETLGSVPGITTWGTILFPQDGETITQIQPSGWILPSPPEGGKTLLRERLVVIQTGQRVCSGLRPSQLELEIIALALEVGQRAIVFGDGVAVEINPDEICSPRLISKSAGRYILDRRADSIFYYVALF